MESEFVRFESLFSKLEISCSNKPVSKEIILISLMKRGLKLKCSNNYGIFQIIVKPKPAGLLPSPAGLLSSPAVYCLLLLSTVLSCYPLSSPAGPLCPPTGLSTFPLVCPHHGSGARSRGRLGGECFYSNFSSFNYLTPLIFQDSNSGSGEGGRSSPGLEPEPEKEKRGEEEELKSLEEKEEEEKEEAC